MIATHRVKDKYDKTIGFMVGGLEGKFIPLRDVKKNIIQFENLEELKNGVIRSANEKVPEVKLRVLNLIKYRHICEENQFNRDIQLKLRKWKHSKSGNALVVVGAKHTGKTVEVLKFVYSSYDRIIYVNLKKDKGFRNVMKNFNMFTTEMKWYCCMNGLPDFFDDESTVIVIDSVHESIKGNSSIAKVKSNTKCTIIVISDLEQTVLGYEHDNYRGLDRLNMRVLSFREFCFALGCDIDAKDKIYNSNECDKLYELYEVYRNIGGYPEVVTEYIKYKNINRCYGIIQKIINEFKEAAEKRVTLNNKRCTKKIYKKIYRSILMIPYLYDPCNSKVHTISDELNRTFKRDLTGDVGNLINWFNSNGLLGECILYANGSTDDKPARKIRYYFTDCGIASYIGKQLGVNEARFKGVVTETFAFNELSRLYDVKDSKRLVSGSGVSFSTLGSYELDFFIIDNYGKRYGIEIKYNRGRAKSLKTYLQNGLVDYGIMANHSNGYCANEIKNIPIFSVGIGFPYKSYRNGKEN